MRRLTAAAISLAAVLVAWQVFYDRPGAAAPCPPLDRDALSLPLDKADAYSDFVAKAQRLNARGVCVLEGSFGRERQAFYFTVKSRADARPRIVYFDRDNLRSE